MKKLIAAAIAVISTLALQAQDNATINNYVDSLQMRRMPELIGFGGYKGSSYKEIGQNSAEFKYYFEFADPSVKNSENINNWIGGILVESTADAAYGCEQKPSLSFDPDDISSFRRQLNDAYTNNHLKQLENSDTEIKYSTNVKLCAVVSNAVYTTLYSSISDYTGGAHGMYNTSLRTFDQVNNCEVTAENLFNASSLNDVKALIVEAALQNSKFKEVYADADTAEKALAVFCDAKAASYKNMSLPQPALIKNGVVFTYQVYEIAPYACGTFSFILGYDEIKSLLSDYGLKLIAGK